MADERGGGEAGEPEVMAAGVYLRLMRRGSWEYAERANASAAVIVVAVTPEDRILFVEQRRIPICCATIEMPAGLVGDLGDHDTIEAAAARELEEETGWRAGRIDFLMIGPSSAGMSTEMIAFARARELVRVGAGGGDHTEDIIVHEVPRAGAARWLHGRAAAGYSIDPKLYAGLWFVDHDPDGTPVA
jgi:ADP-ribose pyrophosphatase